MIGGRSENRQALGALNARLPLCSALILAAKLAQYRSNCWKYAAINHAAAQRRCAVLSRSNRASSCRRARLFVGANAGWPVLAQRAEAVMYPARPDCPARHAQWRRVASARRCGIRRRASQPTPRIRYRVHGASAPWAVRAGDVAPQGPHTRQTGCQKISGHDGGRDDSGGVS